MAVEMTTCRRPKAGKAEGRLAVLSPDVNKRDTVESGGLERTTKSRKCKKTTRSGGQVGTAGMTNLEDLNRLLG